MLLEIIKRSNNLQNIIKSITQNFEGLIKFWLFGMILLTIYGIFGYLFFKEDYDKSLGCYSDSLLTTIFTTINYGLRIGEGIGNAM